MICTGDGWHLVGNCKVLVQDRVITYCYKLGRGGQWIPTRIVKWNSELHTYMSVGKITLASFRSGLHRGTLTVE